MPLRPRNARLGLDSLRRPATWNGLVLAAAWLLSTSVVPALVQTGAASRHAVPPRAEWADARRAFDEAREKELEALRDDEKRAVVDRFRAEQPLYADARPAADTIGQYYLTRAAHVAASEPRRREIDRLATDPLREQERLMERLRYLSPSALAFEALLDIAGSGRGRPLRHGLQGLPVAPDVCERHSTIE
jgi:hypothetical protein